ncbi:MAG: hypothetical protein JJ895_15890 [Balneolaceae bacterium]|nr:hypothetical protein [Balneolaceae bacterium]
MKRIISSFSIIALIAFFSVSTFAQPGRGNRGQQQGRQQMQIQDVPTEVRSEAHIAVFDEYLKLTDAQKVQIKKVEEDFAKRGEELRDASMARQRKMVAMRDLRNEHQQALHELLSKEQYAVYLEKKEAIQYDIRQRLKAYSEKGNK